MSKPSNIFIVRHGQSTGNVDKTIYREQPDYSLMLTELGIQQAREVGNKLIEQIGWGRVAIYYSPYFRARQTMDVALSVGFDPSQIAFQREESRLREQEWCGGLRDFMPDAEEERDNYGHFYYRFHRGESCADVEDRVSDFLSTLHRDFAKDDYPRHAVIFAHGMSNRLILKRWFHATVEQFEAYKNPPNGHIYHLRLNDAGKYDLLNPPEHYEVAHQYRYPTASAS